MNVCFRARNVQVAAVGLALLTSLAVVGCAGGPRLFSRSDRAKEARRREADDSKFVERKRARPESDYLREEDDRLARSGSTRTKSTSSRPRTPEEVLAQRRREAELEDRASRTTTKSASIARTSPNRTSRPGESVSRTDTARRPSLDRFEDDWLSDTPSRGTSSRPSSTSGQSTFAKSSRVDDDPFRNSVVGKSTNTTESRTNRGVATVNFDDWDDEDDEEREEELEEQRAISRSSQTARISTQRNPAESKLSSSSGSSRKYLDDFDALTDSSSKLANNSKLSNQSTIPVKPRTAGSSLTTSSRDRIEQSRDLAARTSETRRVSLDRKPRLADDTQLELDPDDAAEFGLAEYTRSARQPLPDKTPKPKDNRNSAENQEPFEPFQKSQGAVLNGELIIETSSLPSRFQRTSAGSSGRTSYESGRVRANTGTNIEINPGPSLPRPSGQISLQSMSESFDQTSLTTATFEKPASRSQGDRLNLDAPLPPILEAQPAGQPTKSKGPMIDLDQPTHGEPVTSRGWRKIGLILGAVLITILGGLSSTRISGLLRSRRQLAPVRVPVPKRPS